MIGDMRNRVIIDDMSKTIVLSEISLPTLRKPFTQDKANSFYSLYQIINLILKLVVNKIYDCLEFMREYNKYFRPFSRSGVVS